MSERFLKWDDLTGEQKQIAVSNYAAIREAEEETPCSFDRALSEAPFCVGYFVLTEDSSVVTCLI